MVRVRVHSAVIAMLVSGCGPSLAPVSESLRTRVHHELRCPRPAIEIVHIGSGGYWVSACGRVTTFSCTRRSQPYAGYVDNCVREGVWTYR